MYEMSVNKEENLEKASRTAWNPKVKKSAELKAFFLRFVAKGFRLRLMEV